MKEYLLGIDIGSGGLKQTLIDFEGHVVCAVSKEYPTYYPQVSWTEQEPNDWFTAFCAGLKDIFERTSIHPRQIYALAIDAATHTAVLTDEKFQVLDRAILWTDQRSIKQSEYLNQHHRDKILKLSYNAPDPLWTLPQLMWIKENKADIWSSIKHIMFAKDYLRYRLTDVYCTDTIDAIGSMLFDAGRLKWSGELCDIAGLDMSCLPPLVSPFDIIGKVTKQAAEDTGLEEGTLVAAGTTDTVMEIFGCGVVETGQSTVKLATAGRICVITDKPYPSQMLVNYPHVITGKWYPGTATKSCAASLRWYRDVFCDLEKETEAKGGKTAYQTIDAAAATIPRGSEGLLFHPYLSGEMTPYSNPHLKASFTGMSAGHGKAHFNRAVMEGISLSLKDSLTVFQDLNVKIDKVKLIGGGAKSPIWQQITADILGIELQLPEAGDSSFGSALLAGVSSGVFKDAKEAVLRCARIKDVIIPDPKSVAIYENLFKVYKEIQEALSPVYTVSYRPLLNQ